MDKIHILQPSYYAQEHTAQAHAHSVRAKADTADVDVDVDMDTSITTTCDDPVNSLDGTTGTTGIAPHSHNHSHRHTKMMMKIPTIAIAAVGNYADLDHLLRHVRSEYNLYHYESLTYSSTSRSDTSFISSLVPYEMEIVHCHPNWLDSESSTNHHVEPPPPIRVEQDDDDLYAAAAMSTVLSVDNMAHMIRNQIMKKLRSATPYHVCTLIAGIRLRQKQQEQQQLSQRPQQINGVDDVDITDTMTSSEDTASTDGVTIGRKTELAERLQKQVRIATSSADDIKKKHNSNCATDIADDHQPQYRPANTLYEPILYWLDEYGSMIDNVPYGVHGYASDMLYSILDQKYHAALSREEAIQLLNECIQQLQTRYMMNTQHRPSSSSSSSNIRNSSFCIKLIDQYGCTQL
jgi:20S proteasome alpha/beta subunit